MDSYCGIPVDYQQASADGHDHDDDDAVDDDIGHEPPPAGIGQDERRMQLRAYNYWSSLLGQRNFPPITDLAAAQISNFADHAVVLDFSDGSDNPLVTMLGEKLAEECGAAQSIARLSDIPGHSLLSCITDHYGQILASRAPIGFEAEFVNRRGQNLLYRGILLPFSSDGENLRHILGVINWKEMADPATTDALILELGSVVASDFIEFL